MTHFGPEAWADFARRNLAPDVEVRMQEHLESGCSACVQTLHVWLGVLEVATGLNLYSPPDGGLHFLKALYRAFPPQKAPSQVDVPRLVPSPMVPALEGIRGAAQSESRHFVFQRGNVLLDVQIERNPQSSEISMAGQLIDPAARDGAFADRRVTLLTEEAELTRTETNQFGEFHVEFLAASDLMLVIHLEAESMLVIPLPSFLLTKFGNGTSELPTEGERGTN
jgi:hypothetical protein